MMGFLKGQFARFRGNEDAVVSIQIVIFSVVLFGMAGLVIDFGRAYSAHSQMQGFVDKAALAAAAELDGNSGAIDRATAAANSVSKSSSFLADESEFHLYDPIYFLSGDPVDENGNFDFSVVESLVTDSDAQAKYVLVIAEPATVRLQLLNLNLGGDGVEKALEGTQADETEEEGYWGVVGGYYNLWFGQDGITDEEIEERNARNEDLRETIASGAADVQRDDFTLSTYAVSKRETYTCGNFETFVMCNPFEDDNVSFADAMYGQAGQMRLTIDLDGAGNPRLDLTNNEIRLGVIKNPAETVNYDPDEVCQGNVNRNNNVLPGWDSNLSDDEYERLQDMCMAAMVNVTDQCVSSELLVKPVEPEVIAQAVNTYFDIWDDPMDQILHNNPTVPSSNLKRNSYFSADIVAASGRLAREEWSEYRQPFVDEAEADRDSALAYRDTMALFGLDDTEMPPEWTTPNDDYTAAQEEYEYQQLVQTAYHDESSNGNGNNAGNTVTPDTGMENHLHYDEDHRWGPMFQESCVDRDSVVSCAIHDNIAPANNTFQDYFQARYSNYIDDNGVDLLNPTTPLEIAVTTASSNYAGYVAVERAFEADLGASDASDGANDDGDYIENEPVNYEYKGSMKQNVGSYERRRKRIAVINCNAMQTYENHNGSYVANYDDTYVAEVVDVIDVFITEPVIVEECATAFAYEDDPLGIVPCAVGDITSGSIMVEYIGSATQELDEMTYIERAELVH